MPADSVGPKTAERRRCTACQSPPEPERPAPDDPARRGSPGCPAVPAPNHQLADPVESSAQLWTATNFFTTWAGLVYIINAEAFAGKG
jgi:hypothetical protein